MIKAIETRYAGCRFRSRLEARWAVFMDTMEIEWQYEPQGFELPSGRYLPDFHLPNLKTHFGRGAWLEVKGGQATSGELRLALDLSVQSGTPVFLLQGDVPRHPTCRCGFELGGVTDAPALMMPYFYSTPRVPECPLATDQNCVFHGAKIVAALEAARSARFEHGEQPTRTQ